MKTRYLILSLMITILAGMVTSTTAAGLFSIDILGSQVQPVGRSLSCSQPKAASAEICRQIEAEILASTVRIYIESWAVKEGETGYEVDYSIGHATLMGDRYLVTHNHFGIPLLFESQAADTASYVTVTLSDSSGRPLFKGPISDFYLAWEGPETLVIGSKDEDLFRKLGFRSARFQDWISTALETGSEVAQVDWDGVTTRVDWTAIQEVNVEDDVPQLVLADNVLQGASGGGIFWQGVHVANNWLQVQALDEAGVLIDTDTMAALNTQSFQDWLAASSAAGP